MRPSVAPTVEPPTDAPTPEGSAVVTVQIVLAAGHVMTLEVDDLSGLLRSARAASRAEVDANGSGGTKDVWVAPVAPGKEHSLSVFWIGGICDESARLAIDTDVHVLTLEVEDGGPCDAVAVGAGVVLTLEGAIDRDRITVERVGSAISSGA